MQEVYLDARKPTVIFDTGTKSITAVDNAGYTTIQTVKVRSGYDARVAIGFDVAPGAAAFASFRVLINGNPWTDEIYNDVQSQPASTTDPLALSVNMRDLPEGALLQVQGRLVSAGANYALYSRVRIEYLEK